MTTEYRRGVPSTAHVEAATRLGLEWEDDDVGPMKARWRLVVHEESIRGDYATSNTNYSNWDSSPFDRVPYQNSSYRPIRPDGTPVDWEVLDQEVARVGQPQTMACNLTAPAQPRGFRADLWQALSSYLTPGNGCGLLDTVRLNWRGFRVQNPFFTAEIGWPVGFNPADIIARWTVYQELKPLYDIVDGAQSEVVMPRDVEAEWHLQATTERDPLAEGGRFGRDTEGVYLQCRSLLTWRSHEDGYGVPLRNFAAVLDAVAEQRAAARANTPTAKPTPLPRFTADELDDVDHSATTTQDSATLKRGKLPTVEAIGKYREVMAKRNGTVAEAVKASGIDCEVAQYVLERWAGGLSDREAKIICDEAYGAVSFTRADIAKRLSHWFAIIRPTLDTSEPADTAAQRQRAEAAERKVRMAALQAQLAKERAARIAEPEPELSRFALLEVDEAADPSKSIEAWKAQRAANERRARNTVRPVTVTSPPPAPKRKPFEVVDVEADGLSGGAAFAVLLSRAMNQNC